MSPESEALLALAESIADGSPVDWDKAESQVSEGDRPVVRQLRVLAELAVLHRTLPGDSGERPATRASQRTLATPAIGSWGHLALLERLGGGASGEVYRAWDPQLEREVALKLLRGGELLEDPDTSRITREGRLLARVRHQNVVTVHGVARHDGRVGLWMELVRGATLEQTLQTRGPFSAHEAALIGIDLCRALAAIHAAGLVHRDVKAQNVVREEGGRIVLMDLGTGREIGAIESPVRELAGTPLYLAPEIFNGAAAGVQTDIYSLGILLYRLVTGRFPVGAETFDDLRSAHAAGKLARLRDVRPDLPAAFVRVVERAIARDPAQRYDSAGALESDLLEAVSDRAPLPAGGVIRGVSRDAGETRTRRALRIGMAVAAAVLVIVLVVYFSPVFRRAARGAAADSIRSIAVLPLVNLSGEPAQEYFADGMTDELISTLGRIEGLNVISRTSVMQFKGSTTPIPEIARTLAVDAVLEGSVWLQPVSGSREPRTNRVRINARLIAAGTDTRLWERTFETVVGNVLALQREVAKAVADGIHLRLSEAKASGGPLPNQPAAQDFEAFTLYLKGRYHWNLRTPDNFRRSIVYFQQALDRDPDYAAAHAGIADAYTLLGVHEAMPYAEAFGRAHAAATKAVVLDDGLPEAHTSLALVQGFLLEWHAADASFKRAFALNPADARAHHWYSAHLVQRGRFAEAIAAIDRAMNLDPLSVAVHSQRAAILFLSRRYDETIAQAKRALELNPNLVRAHVFVAEAHAMKGELEQAFAAAGRAAELGGRTPELQSFVGCFLAMANRRGEANATAEDLIARFDRRREGGPMNIAQIYACLGDHERTSAWLQRAREFRDPWLAYVGVAPWYDGLRDDPDFRKFLATIRRAY